MRERLSLFLGGVITVATVVLTLSVAAAPIAAVAYAIRAVAVG